MSSTSSRLASIGGASLRPRRSRARGPRTPARASASASASSSFARVDAAFAAAASGEWEGHRVYFDASGAPAPLPDNVLPPAFKEWGQVLVDWQSQCAMRVDPDDRDAAVYARELRFLPTAGCEADSSTVETAYARTVPAADVTPAPADAAVAPGTYSAGPTRLPAAAAAADAAAEAAEAASASAFVVEHCLGFDDPADDDTRARVRVQQRLALDPSSGLLAVADVSAWKEYYYEPFADAASLCASCGGPNKWGDTKPRDADDVDDGAWERSGDGDGEAWGGFAAGAEHLAMLPAGVWSAAWREAGGGFALEAGWVVPVRDAAYLPPKRDRETLVASRRRYDAGGELVEAAFFQSTRPPRPA